MDEDKRPIARRGRMNNERQTRYRARQPSDARRQTNAESQPIRRQQETTKRNWCEIKNLPQLYIFLLSRHVLTGFS